MTALVEFINLADNSNHVITESAGMFHVIEHNSDLSVAPDNAMKEYFMKKMGVVRRQIMIKMDGTAQETCAAVCAGKDNLP